MGQIEHDLLVRLRTEGQKVVVMSIPLAIRQELCLKAGDLVVCKVEAGALVARKVELRGVVAAAGRPVVAPTEGQSGGE